VAVKSASSAAGLRLARGGAANVGSDATVEALFRQTGIIRVGTLEQLFDVAQVLVNQPLPAGRRVAVVGNADGPAVLAADALEQLGMEVPEQAAGRLNPVDLGADATAAEYETALDAVLTDEGIDAVITIFIPPLVTEAEEVAAALRRAAAGTAKPVVANFLARRGVSLDLVIDDGRAIPSFTYPESAALALARVATDAEWRRRPERSTPPLAGLDIEAGRAIVAKALTGGATVLDDAAAGELLAAFGISVPQTRAPAVAVTTDPLFGPLMQIGDTTRIVPLADENDDLLLRLSALVEAVPELTALTLDPLTVEVAPWEPRPELALRRLR